ncbi:MAG: RHS repeat protein [Acidobacteria bacterium]|nr:RHS repeat protein [Acidobacteriota bacterium]
MLKIACLSLIICCLAPLSARAQKRSEREQSGLFGLVQSVKTEEAEIVFENGKPVEGKRELSSLETYDINGNPLISASYTDDKEILHKDTYVYDAAGRVIEQRTEHSPYSYLPDRKVLVYDDKGNVVEEDGYDLQNKLLGKRTYVYDEQGNLIEEESVKLDDSKQVYGNSLTKYKYDGNGNRIERATYQRDGSALRPYDFRLGYYREIYLYDAKGRRIATSYIGLDEKLYRTDVTTYDDRGNELESATYNADGTVHERKSYVYEFDRQGNYIKQTTLDWVTEDGKSFFRPTEVEYRAITYFKSAPKSANKPATVQPNVLQNTDAEDYAVYAAILNPYFDEAKIRLLVIKKFTEGFNTDEPEQRKELSPDNFALREVEQATIDDYVEKNRNKGYQLLDELLSLKGKHAFVMDAEMNEIFAKDCNKGWGTFYKKYPDSQGMTTLSKVGFNKERTQALVYVGTQSHCLAGAGHFIILAKQNGAWKVVRESMVWIS